MEFIMSELVRCVWELNKWMHPHPQFCTWSLVDAMQSDIIF